MNCPPCNIYLAFFSGIIIGIMFLIFAVGFAQVIMDEVDRRKKLEARLNNSNSPIKNR